LPRPADAAPPRADSPPAIAARIFSPLPSLSPQPPTHRVARAFRRRRPTIRPASLTPFVPPSSPEVRDGPARVADTGFPVPRLAERAQPYFRAAVWLPPTAFRRCTALPGDASQH